MLANSVSCECEPLVPFTLRTTSRHPLTQRSLMLMQNECTATPWTSSEPPPSPDSRSTCDGWRPKPRHDRRPRAPAHRLRAYQAAHLVNCPRWHASAHTSAEAGCSSALPSRCVLRSVTNFGPTLW